jgi:AraC-like DNA-binding protein
VALAEIAYFTQPVILLCVDVEVKVISPPHARGETIVPNVLQGEWQGRIFAPACNGWTAAILKERRTQLRIVSASFKCLSPDSHSYVTEWRMQKATPFLEQHNKKLIDVARSVGYESDAAFSKAFKRVVGANPGEYRKRGFEDRGYVGTTEEF